MLNYFDDETENGKLYINYPMFEAAFYLDDFVNPKEVFAYQKVDECTGRIFKKKVREISCFGKRNHLDFTLSRTIDVLQCIKWNYIRQKEITGKEEIDYKKILEKQIELKNSSDHKIMILSTFILMTVDYNPKILNVVSEKLGLIL